jgi:phosphatidylinositol-3-phosphatase
MLSAALLALVTPALVAGAASRPAVPRFSHVVYVVLENESATSTFESSAAPNLLALRKQGLYIPGFFAEGHASLDNYEAMFAAVEPTTQGKADCAGQPYSSCIFPASVPTLGALMDAKHLPWKIYSEGMAGAPLGGNCLHAVSRSLPDFYQGPLTNGYATRHNPAAWFASVLDKGGNEDYCKAHSVDLSQLWQDAAARSTLPAWSFVEPDTCHDGHDTSSSGGCAPDPEGPTAPAGVAAIDAWLPGFVQRLTSSPAWDSHSLLVITTDEGATTDTAGCARCADTSAGGRVGTLLLSKLVRAGTTTAWQGDHYALLRTWEAAWGLPTLKSRAADETAAKTVHDGDPGVRPLTGVWR